VPYPGRPYGPGGVVTASGPGLLLQQEHRVDIFQAPNGDWYIAHNGNVLGHYPAGLFRMLNQGACRAAWYGEVFDPTPTDWTWTNMGSGQFAVDGYGYAAYVRDPMYLDLNYAPLVAQDDPTKPDRFSVVPFVDSCYTRSQLPGFAPSWVRTCTSEARAATPRGVTSHGCTGAFQRIQAWAPRARSRGGPLCPGVLPGDGRSSEGARRIPRGAGPDPRPSLLVCVDEAAARPAAQARALRARPGDRR
jgi:Neprosin